jgi:hypothetical protein
VDISSSFLPGLPETLREELTSTFNGVLENYSREKWEPAELNAGKFCEVVYTIIKGYVDGRYPAKAQKPRSMVDACRGLEQAPNSIPRSIRIQIPRLLLSLYEIRNNRNVGHVGGDVNPNQMDSKIVLYMTKWIVAELVRVFHNVDIGSASEKIKLIIDRINPEIWQVDNNFRVLNNNLTMKEKTLLILYHKNGKVDESLLVRSIEPSNPSVYRRDVLWKCHKSRLLEYNPTNKTAELSPLGCRYVEDNVLRKIN